MSAADCSCDAPSHILTALEDTTLDLLELQELLITIAAFANEFVSDVPSGSRGMIH